MKEHKIAPECTISELKVEDIDEVTEMRLQSWLDTYPSEEHGISREWVSTRNQRQRQAEVVQARRDRFISGKASGTMNGWVARNVKGKVVGACTPYVDEDGTQHVGSLHINKDWYGTGLGSALMQRIIEWFDSSKPITLSVVSYNERAKAFYRKWGFIEKEGSEGLFDNKLPELTMMRQGDGK